MFTVYKKWKGDLYDFTDIVGSIEMRSNSSEIAESVTMEISQRYINESNVVVIFENDNIIFEGVVTTISYTGEKLNTAILFDYGWYLNKSEDIYQFNDNIDICIKKILDDYEIPYSYIENIPLNYNKISKGALSEIIKELLEYATKTTGIKYIWGMNNNRFYLEKQTDNVVVYRTSYFNSNVDVTKLLNKTATINRNIENLKNSIKVVSEEENGIQVLSLKEDKASIDLYGKLQKIEILSDEEKNNANSIGNNQLKSLNKIEDTLTCILPGNMECKANKILNIVNKTMDIDDKYIIRSCIHQISKKGHTMDLELEVI